MGSRNLAPDGEMRPSTSPVKEYHVFERFCVARRKDGSFNAVSAILIHKTILANVGEVKSVKKCNNGNLLIEVWSQQQATSIMKIERIAYQQSQNLYELHILIVRSDHIFQILCGALSAKGLATQYKPAVAYSLARDAPCQSTKVKHALKLPVA
ncbi:hypothetical protein AVEN_21778-1 [Araneus ventricosus]|uniref:Uncharacterized protein n=1 Tax=Araneus ventricosus TaxID=182803 RepID=A0A4Y2NK98_ARAVE|nr:hypothetical protein AVEN_21778-1 [Araneus ventricosus]